MSMSEKKTSKTKMSQAEMNETKKNILETEAPKQESQEPIKLYVLTGFLGAGKTTLLLHLLEHFADKKIGVIQNEFGRLGVDGPRLRQDGIEMVEINRGSIFCSCLKLSFVQALAELGKRDLDFLFVESSGLSDPSNIHEILSAVAELGVNRLQFCGMICLIDAVNFFRQCSEETRIVGTVFPGHQTPGRSIPGENGKHDREGISATSFKAGKHPPYKDEEDEEDRRKNTSENTCTVTRQLAHCQLALINKVDLVDDVQLKKVEEAVRHINPHCLIARSERGHFDLELLNQDLLSRSRTAACEASLNTNENKPKTFSLSCGDVLPSASFMAFLKVCQADAFRIKGTVHLDTGWRQVDTVEKLIDLKETEAQNESTLVFLSKIGPELIRTVDRAWKAQDLPPMKLKN